jgi:two-component system response regulator RstA
MEQLTLLLIEDDARLAQFTAEYLQRYDVKVTHVADGERGLREALRARYDAVLLDLMLPIKDGLSVCRDIRTHSDVPILMLTARGEEVDRVLGLELGADDYMPKPFSPRELLARVRAVVRRRRGLAGPAQLIQLGSLSVSIAGQTATLAGRALQLTNYEFAILRVLLERRGRVVTREQILDLAKGNTDESFDRSVDVRISRLRQKLEEEAGKPSLIRTVRGLGYMIVAESDT